MSGGAKGVTTNGSTDSSSGAMDAKGDNAASGKNTMSAGSTMGTTSDGASAKQ
jgi:hypothetical protein